MNADMPHYYLSTFIGTGEGDDAYRPPTSQPYSLIDLRGDPTRQDGYALLVVADPLPQQADAHKLADKLDEQLSARTLATIRTRLGVTLQPGTLRAGIVELLLRHGTPNHDKTRWNRVHTNSRRRHKIVLGGEVVYDAPDIQNLTVTDDFNRADEDLEASANWSVTVADSSYQIVSNELQIPGASGVLRNGHWSADNFGPDCFAQAVYVTLGTGTGTAGEGVVVRGDETINNFYMGRDNTPAYDLGKMVVGSFTRIASGGTAVEGTYRLEADGSTLTLLVDSTQELQTTDTSLTGAGRCGFTIFATDGGTWDDFEAADLPTLTGILFTKAATFPVGNLSRGRSWVDDKVAYTKLEPSEPNPL